MDKMNNSKESNDVPRSDLMAIERAQGRPIQFYSPSDVAACCGLSRDSVYRYHREVKSRELQKPISNRWPMEQFDALRFIEYIQKRTRKK